MRATYERIAGAPPLLTAAWVFAAFLGSFYLGSDLARALTNPAWQVGPQTIFGRDFVNVFTGGHLVLDGGLARIYDLVSYERYQSELFAGAVSGHNYSYAPVSFFYVWAFALLPYGVAYFLWIGLTGAAFVLAARPYLRSAGVPGWAALLMPAAMMNIWAGHYGFLFGALWLTVWRLVETRPRLAGLLVGLMIVKPHLALLMPIALARRRAWTPFVYAGLTSLALVVASGVAFGWGHWAVYLGHTSAVQAAMIDDTGAFFLRMMPTVFPALLFAGAGAGMAWVAQGAAACAAIAALWKWMPDDPMRAGLSTAIATFLVLPYAFNYDMTVVGIAALVAMHDPGLRKSEVRQGVAVFVFLLPGLLVFFNAIGLAIAPMLLAAMLICSLGIQSRRLVRRDGEPIPA